MINNDVLRLRAVVISRHIVQLSFGEQDKTVGVEKQIYYIFLTN